MAKFLDENGLSHFYSLLKSKFSIKSHTHSVSVGTGDSVTVSAGSAASLTTTTATIPNVTDVGTPTTASVAFGNLSITNGSAPSLGNAITVKGVDVFTANTPTAVTKKTVVTSVGGTTGAASA